MTPTRVVLLLIVLLLLLIGADWYEHDILHARRSVDTQLDWIAASHPLLRD
jgi:hypothetical protein